MCFHLEQGTILEKRKMIGFKGVAIIEAIVT
jgi:hypothetical protein